MDLDQTQTTFPTEPAPPSDEMDTINAACQRAAIALLTKIETTANAPGDNHYEISQLSKAYREIVGHPVTTVVATGQSTLDTSDHLLLLEHFYACIRFDCHLPPRIEPVSYEDVKECLDAARAQYNAINDELLAAKMQIDEFSKCLDAIEDRIAKAVHDATGLDSTSMYKEDFAAARSILPEEPDQSTLFQGLAFRFATIRELSALASSAPKLRAELQAANEEVASLREQLATLQKNYDGASKARDANAESSVLAWKDLDAIRDRLAADGFSCVNVVAGVETALENLRDAQKERDASASKLDEIQRILVDNGFVSESAESPKFAAHGVTWLLDALSETQKERDEANKKLNAVATLLDGKPTDFGDDDPDISRLADLASQYDELQAAIKALRAELAQCDTLLKDARKWTTYDFEINSHGRRMDVIRSLAGRAEALHGVLDALSRTDLDPGILPAYAVSILIERITTAQGIADQYAVSATQLQMTIEQVQRDLDIANAPQSTSFADRIRAFAMQAERWRSDLHVVQDENVAVAEALGLAGKTADLRTDAAKIVQERDAMAKKLASAQGALAIANDHIRLVDENLRRALTLSPEGKAVSDLTDLMQALVELVAFWRRGAEPFRQAAEALEVPIKKVLGESYGAFVLKVQEVLQSRKVPPKNWDEHADDHLQQ
jgi:hypothetical protein